MSAGGGVAPSVLDTLEFPAALERVAAHAVSPLGAARVKSRRPATEAAAVQAGLAQVAELASRILTDDAIRAEPAPDITAPLELLGVPGSVLEGAALVQLGDTLVATVQETLHDRDALALQAELGAALERTGARGLLLDVSVVETVDSFLGRLLSEIAAGARLLGAQTVVAGIQPPVAITLVELGLGLPGVRTALDPERGMALLRRLIAAEEAGRATSRNRGGRERGG